MKVRVISKYIVTAFILVFAGVSYASDPCAPVQREMTFGETAVEMADNKAGFLKAAQEFEKAAQKAPLCSAAYFNLGVVLEKAEQFSKAKQAFETYLGLVPDAEDAQQINNRIYRLEYLSDNYGTDEGSDVGRKDEDANATIQALTGRWITADREHIKFAFIITPDGKGGVLLEFDRCVTGCEGFTPNPVNRFSLQATGQGSLSGIHESQWVSQACAGRTYQAPAEAFLASDQRSLIIKIREHTLYNTFSCKFEKGNAITMTLTR